MSLGAVLLTINAAVLPNEQNELEQEQQQGTEDSNGQLLIEGNVDIPSDQLSSSQGMDIEKQRLVAQQIQQELTRREEKEKKELTPFGRSKRSPYTHCHYACRTVGDYVVCSYICH